MPPAFAQITPAHSPIVARRLNIFDRQTASRGTFQTQPVSLVDRDRTGSPRHRREKRHRRSDLSDDTDDSRERYRSRSRGRQWGDNGNKEWRELEEAKELADDMIIQAEKFKAAVNSPKGMPSSQDPFNKLALCLKEVMKVDDDDEFFHVSCHIENSLKEKIERGEFVDLEKLLPKTRNQILKNERKLQIFERDGEAFLGTGGSETRINSVRKWDQAFRVYATIYPKANPTRSAKIWQYIYVIHMAASSYSWENVAYYDVTFRQLMANRPQRSWAKTYNQLWNLAMCDPLGKNVNHFSPNASGNQNTTPRDWHDNCCWWWNKGKCKRWNCKFDHRCSYCGAYSHNFGQCNKKRESTENFDMESIVTPVDHQQLKFMLENSDYDPVKTRFLVNSFKNGFSLGYQGSDKVQLRSPNLRLTFGDEIDLWNKVIKEVKLKRYAGPFKAIPFKYFIQSPIGLVPKDNRSDLRLIFHLSYPRNSTEKLSVNANTPEELTKVKYPDFSAAVVRCLEELKGSFNCCFVGRSDVKAAFRNLGISREYWKFLVMKAKSTLDGRWYFFFDKCLAFGASISCAHVQSVSDAIAHLVLWRTKKVPINFLDDLFFTAIRRQWCNRQLQIFIEICEQIKLPVNMDKTHWGTTCLSFLGFLIDTVKRIICIPQQKVVKVRNMISYVLSKSNKKLTLLQLQKICGFLNFLGRAVLPGRAFTRRLYAQMCGFKGVLKPHHHIKITAEMRMDLEMWEVFLTHQTAFCRPFTDFSNVISGRDIAFYMDASKNELLGFGKHCGSSWMAAAWPEELILKFNLSIEFLELYAMTAGILAWLHNFQNSKLVLHCDNQSVVHMMNQHSSKCGRCMVLIRIIVLYSLINNVRIYAVHVRSAKNEIADSLSRFQMRRFERLTKNMKMDAEMTPVPQAVWPMEKVLY